MLRWRYYDHRAKLTAASASEAVMSGRTWRTGVLGLIGRLAPRPAGRVELLVAGLEPTILPVQVLAGVELVGIVDSALATEKGVVAFFMGQRLWVFGHVVRAAPPEELAELPELR